MKREREREREGGEEDLCFVGLVNTTPGIFIRIIREYLPARLKSKVAPRQENIAKYSWEETRSPPRPRRPLCILDASERRVGRNPAAWRIVTVLIFFRSPWGLWARGYYSAHPEAPNSACLLMRLYPVAASSPFSYFRDSVMPRGRAERVTSASDDEETSTFFTQRKQSWLN